MFKGEIWNCSTMQLLSVYNSPRYKYTLQTPNLSGAMGLPQYSKNDKILETIFYDWKAYCARRRVWPQLRSKWNAHMHVWLHFSNLLHKQMQMTWWLAVFIPLCTTSNRIKLHPYKKVCSDWCWQGGSTGQHLLGYYVCGHLILLRAAKLEQNVLAYISWLPAKERLDI